MNLNQIRKTFIKDNIAIFPLRVMNHSANHPYPDANFLVKHSKKMGSKWMESDHYQVKDRQLETEADVIEYFENEIRVVRKIIALATISKDEAKDYLRELNGRSEIINIPDADNPDFLDITETGINQKINYHEIDSPKYVPDFWYPILEALEYSLSVLKESNFGKI